MMFIDPVVIGMEWLKEVDQAHGDQKANASDGPHCDHLPFFSTARAD
jgi:hypothetical protein